MSGRERLRVRKYLRAELDWSYEIQYVVRRLRLRLFPTAGLISEHGNKKRVHYHGLVCKPH